MSSGGAKRWLDGRTVVEGRLSRIQHLRRDFCASGFDAFLAITCVGNELAEWTRACCVVSDALIVNLISNPALEGNFFLCLRRGIDACGVGPSR